MPEVFANNASTTLASGISSGALSLTLATGDGALFPVLTGADYFYATLEEGATREIVKVTARASDVCTIVRAQQGTTASAFTTAATVEQRITKATLESLQAVVGIGAPVSPVDGNAWVEVSGVSPNRIAALKVKDGSDVITIASVSY